VQQGLKAARLRAVLATLDTDCLHRLYQQFCSYSPPTAALTYTDGIYKREVSLSDKPVFKI